MRNLDIQFLWISFLYFLLCYAAASTGALLSHRQQEESRLGFEAQLCFYSALCVRCGYIVLAMAVLLPLYWVQHDNVPKPVKHVLSRLGVQRDNAHIGKLSGTVALIVFIGCLSSLISDILCLTGDYQFGHVVEVLFFMTILAHNCGLLFPQCMAYLVACVLVTITLAVIGWGENADKEPLFEVAFSLLIMLALQLMAIYYVQGRQRLTFGLILATREEHQRASRLLNSMLPQEVLLDMKSGSMSLAYSYTDMTILCSDIVDFTKYCASHSVEQAVSLITRLFAEFDEYTGVLGLYKVCTIGDAYIVVNQPQARTVDKDHACLRVFAMATWMLKSIIKIRAEVDHLTLDMRIGIHYGSFVAGVIGTKRVRFDVWGPDVLAANLVEQNGIAGEVVVSQPARIRLGRSEQAFCFEFHKQIELRNRGSMNTYTCSALDRAALHNEVDPCNADSEDTDPI